MRVVGAGAVPGHQQRDRFVQVVHDGGVPLVEHAVHRLRGLVRLLVGVAVDVDERVLRPVRRRLARQGAVVGLALQVAVEPLDHLVAAVGVGDGVDEHHDLLADAPDHGLLGDGEAVGQLQHGFGGAGLVGVERRVEVVDGPRRSAIRRSAAAGSVRRGSASAAVAAFSRSRSADAVLVGDRDHQDLAAFLAAADREDPHARRGGGQRAAVGVGLGGVDELARRAGDASQEVARRRHGRRFGQVGDPGRKEARLRRGRAIASMEPGSATSGAPRPQPVPEQVVVANVIRGLRSVCAGVSHKQERRRASGASPPQRAPRAKTRLARKRAAATRAAAAAQLLGGCGMRRRARREGRPGAGRRTPNPRHRLPAERRRLPGSGRERCVG